MTSVFQDHSGRVQAESRPMRALRRLGLDGLAWPLRRLHVPVSEDALVLEVGSGGNPYPRSNVLLDAYESTRERHFQPLVVDRPTVLAVAEKLPFKDNAFDFVIASHVLEHALDPHAFLAELQRVASAGYIECPDALFERLNPYRDHRLEVTERDGELLLRPKHSWRHDPEVVELYEARLYRSRPWAHYLRRHAFAFHLRYYWSRDAGGIRYHLVGPNKAAGAFIGGGEGQASTPQASQSLRTMLVSTARWLMSQRKRNASLDLASLLRCPACDGTSLAQSAKGISCSGCGRVYETDGRLVRMWSSAPNGTGPGAH